MKLKIRRRKYQNFETHFCDDEMFSADGENSKSKMDFFFIQNHFYSNGWQNTLEIQLDLH
jgi:hypothetical protein